MVASGASINSTADVSVGVDSNMSLALLITEEPLAIQDLNIVEGNQPACGSSEVTIDQSAAGTDSDSVKILNSIHEISPVPKCQKERIRRRKSQVAAVLTSSPFKKMLMEKRPQPKLGTKSLPDAGQEMTSAKKKKNKKKERPEKRKTVTETKRKTERKVTCRGQNENTKKLPLPRAPKKKQCDDGQSRQFYCIYCSELFVDPPDEDWKQCIECLKWYHEQCGNDSDICDLCRNTQ